jgi:hypothetical protein
MGLTSFRTHCELFVFVHMRRCRDDLIAVGLTSIACRCHTLHRFIFMKVTIGAREARGRGLTKLKRYRMCSQATRFVVYR